MSIKKHRRITGGVLLIQELYGLRKTSQSGNPAGNQEQVQKSKSVFLFKTRK
ncbi:MAG: hypothetical protein ACQEUT_03230 [Bacillota bacterium]